MKKYIKGLNHASSIHHVNKFKFEKDQYEDIKKDFDNLAIDVAIILIY